MLPDLALMDQQRMRTLLVPPTLAQASLSQHPLGISEHAGHRLSVGFPAECLHAHMLVVGKSGEGKSTGMEHLARAAMEQDGGMLLLDPHGDLVDHVLELIPSQRHDDVMIIDLADPLYSVGLNPLDVTIGRGRDKAISDLLKTLAHIWVGAWGSRMENAFEYALRTLYEANKYLVDHTTGGAQSQYTLLDVMVVLTSESFCHALLQKVTDPYIHRWWNLYYDPLSLQMQRDRIDPVLSKVAKFESFIARRIVGQSTTTLHFAKAIAERKLMFFKLSKNRVGEDMARLLGATLLGLLNIALEEQGSVAQYQRRPLTILVDEFQVLEGVDWGSIAELRKYGATFFLATQSLDYLQAGSIMEHTSVLSTVMSNVKQYMIFHVSAHDAAILAPELGIELADLLNLDSFTCYTKLTYQNRRQPTFSLHLDLPPRGDRQQAQGLIERSRRHYGVPAALIDERLTTSLITAISAQPHDETKPSASSSPVSTIPAPESSLPHPRRKAQEKRERERANPEETQPETGETGETGETSPVNHTTAMSWEETVGHLPDPASKESHDA
jgi:energy-coupling factor transporter ATP-binding protein EcfA2